MKIVEKDFILVPADGKSFDLYFPKKVKDKTTGEVKVVPAIEGYNLDLGGAIKRICRNRVNTAFESETPCLLEYLKKIEEQQEEMLRICREIKD